MTPPKRISSRDSISPKENLPRHIAVIMDGNNRWSKQHKKNGVSGHRAGAVTARNLVDFCHKKKIDVLTLFVFSSENWLRPKKEVNSLMALFLNVLQKNEINKLHKQNIRVRFIGSRERFTGKLLKLMVEAEALTANNTSMTVVVAADYGGHWDMANAAQLIAEKIESGDLKSKDVNEALVQQHIAIADLPMPDLCIRTGGEQRISNFLLWQFAYTELYFTDTFWPDFDEKELDKALNDFAGRQRRFGKISDQVESAQ
jgi:undecaprenyl diphosphate synthase